MDSKQAYLDAARKDIEERDEQIGVSLSDWPTFPAEPLGVRICYDQSPYFVFPYDRKLMAQIKEALTTQGWELDYEHDETKVNSNWDDPRQAWSRHPENCAWPRPKFSVEFSDRMPGSVCKRKEIGTRAGEAVPVYDFACEGV